MKLQVTMDKAALDEMLGKAPAKVDLEKLALVTWRKFGEAEGVADALREEYRASDAGSNTRRAIIETVLKLFMASREGGESELISDDDLRAEAKKILADTSD